MTHPRVVARDHVDHVPELVRHAFGRRAALAAVAALGPFALWLWSEHDQTLAELQGLLGQETHARAQAQAAVEEALLVEG